MYKTALYHLKDFLELFLFQNTFKNKNIINLCSEKMRFIPIYDPTGSRSGVLAC